MPVAKRLAKTAKLWVLQFNTKWKQWPHDRDIAMIATKSVKQGRNETCLITIITAHSGSNQVSTTRLHIEGVLLTLRNLSHYINENVYTI